MERWNFDFEHEKPLHGRYEWVRNEQGNEISESKETDGGTNQQEKRAEEAENNAEH